MERSRHLVGVFYRKEFLIGGYFYFLFFKGTVHEMESLEEAMKWIIGVHSRTLCLLKDWKLSLPVEGSKDTGPVESRDEPAVEPKKSIERSLRL